MKLRVWFEQLADRERKLVLIFLSIWGALVVLGVPVWVILSVSSQGDRNQAIEEAINTIVDERLTLAKRTEMKARVSARYDRQAPSLAGFLAGIADKVGVDIPETQDRSVVPHGKTFKERQTRIRLVKVGMRKLTDFMDAVENSGYPVIISHLDIKKRGMTPDEFDADMDISAFDHDEPKAKPKPKAKKSEADLEAKE